MAKNLQIRNEIFPYPEPGDNPGWGENATAWATAVTDALSTIQGPNDILITSAIINNNQSSPTAISGLVFNTAQVRSVNIQFFITRVYDSGSSVLTDSGVILGDYDGSTFVVSPEHTRDAGVIFDVTNGGQLTYTSSNLANHVSSTIRFKASTIDAP